MSTPAGIFVHYSRANQEWETPGELFDRLDAEFRFSLDAAASWTTAKCPHFFDAETDGLAQPWAPHVVWCNPPYGAGVERWVAKAAAEAARGATCVLLLPARTDTAWWHDHVQGRAEVRFLRGRVPFVRSDGRHSRAPFPSVLVVFRPGEVSHG